jgi:hypothetical protein
VLLVTGVVRHAATHLVTHPLTHPLAHPLAPTHHPWGEPDAAVGRRRGWNSRAVALQVAFERRILKPVFHLIGYRLWV